MHGNMSSNNTHPRWGLGKLLSRPRDPTTDPARRFAPRARRLDFASGPEMSSDLMHRMRQELTILGETLSAYLLAGCKRVLSFGFDESTKLQARISLNLPPTPARPRMYIVARTTAAPHLGPLTL